MLPRIGGRVRFVPTLTGMVAPTVAPQRSLLVIGTAAAGLARSSFFPPLRL
jgi:hypothetical protein